MSDEDTDTNTNDGGGLKKLFESNRSGKKKSEDARAQGAVAMEELVATNVDEGIFKSIKDCSRESIVVEHPKKGEDAARKLRMKALDLRASKKFDEAQKITDQYKQKLQDVDIAKSAVQTLKNVISYAEKERKKCDNNMEFAMPGKWDSIVEAATFMLRPYLDEERRILEKESAAAVGQERRAQAPAIDLTSDDGRETHSDDDAKKDLVPSDMQSKASCKRKHDTTKSTDESATKKTHHATPHSSTPPPPLVGTTDLTGTSWTGLAANVPPKTQQRSAYRRLTPESTHDPKTQQRPTQVSAVNMNPDAASPPAAAGGATLVPVTPGQPIMQRNDPELTDRDRAELALKGKELELKEKQLQNELELKEKQLQQDREKTQKELELMERQLMVQEQLASAVKSSCNAAEHSAKATEHSAKATEAAMNVVAEQQTTITQLVTLLMRTGLNYN